jgi:3',5'-cyclic AMP phosphodiesterase CpdA
VPGLLNCQAPAVAKAIEARNVDAVLLPGDLQYYYGEETNFRNSFAKDWSPVLSRSYAVPGNHEYATPEARGYFNFWMSQTNGLARGGEPGKGYYSFNLGDWHIIALNSNCTMVGGCEAGSVQARWLENDLVNNNTKCTLAFWHHPVFTSGKYQGIESQTNRGKYFWELLSKYNADVVATGHDHIYERFAPQTSNGVLQPKRGIREFVIGTGGIILYKLHIEKTPNHELGIENEFGFLELELSESSYAWQFIGIDGVARDAGRSPCHS